MIDVTVVFLENGPRLDRGRTARGVPRRGRALERAPGRSPRSRASACARPRSAAAPSVPTAPYTIQPDLALDEVGATDLVFVGSARARARRAARTQRAGDRLPARAPTRAARASRACARASRSPAAAGLLDGRPATTHWGLVDEYRARFPRVDWRAEEMVTESDGVYCGGGVHAALDLALYLVEKLVRPHRRRAVREEPADRHAARVPDRLRRAAAGRAPRRRARAPGRGLDPPPLPRGGALRRARARARHEPAQLHAPLQGRDRARAGRVPPAPARARGAAPARGASTSTVQEVGRAVGYEDAAFFRALFKRHTGMTPTFYRRRFAAATSAPSGANKTSAGSGNALER